MPAPRASAAAAGAATVLAAWTAYYVLRCRLPPAVRAGPTALNAALLARLPSLHAPYAPPVWAFNAWVQLVIYLIRHRRRPRNTSFRRETLTAADGGQIALDWHEPEGAAADAPCLLLLHTITGTSRDFVELARLAAARGWRAAVCLRRASARWQRSGRPTRRTRRCVPRAALAGRTAQAARARAGGAARASGGGGPLCRGGRGGRGRGQEAQEEAQEAR